MLSPIYRLGNSLRIVEWFAYRKQCNWNPKKHIHLPFLQYFPLIHAFPLIYTLGMSFLYSFSRISYNHKLSIYEVSSVYSRNYFSSKCSMCSKNIFFALKRVFQLMVPIFWQSPIKPLIIIYSFISLTPLCLKSITCQDLTFLTM